MKKYDFLLVGTGLFSAVCADILTKNGKKCLVVEKRPHIGGNIYTKNEDGINIHKYGAHIFHTNNKKVWEYINSFSEFNGFINMPKADFNGKRYSLPFNMNTFHELWGVNTPKEAEKRIEESIKTDYKENPENLEEQAINLVGREVYEVLIKGYTEKQWGRDCKELPSFIIKRLPLRFTFDNNYFNDDFQGIPVGGYTKIIEKMLARSDVRLGCDFLKEKDELKKICDKVIFTGRIDEYYDKCFGELEYRSLKFEEEKLNIPDFQGNAVINYTSRDVPYTRIIEHKHFENANTDFTVITKEYPQIFNGKNEPFYPVNDEKNNALYEKYKALSEKENDIFFGGRLGNYKYYDMDKTTEEAFLLAEKLLKLHTKSSS